MNHSLLSLLGALVVIVLVMAGAYFFTRWAGKIGVFSSLTRPTGNGRLQVLDRVPLGKDQWLLVIQMGTRYFLLGSTPSALTMLSELTPEEGALWHSPSSHDDSSQRISPDFQALLRVFRDKNQG